MALCSCATMLNSKKTSVTITTSEPSKLVINNDTLKNKMLSSSFIFDRGKKPIIVTAFTDSLTKTVSIQSKNSFAYWLNVYPNIHFWTGFYIDTKTKKRYTYPKTVFIDFALHDSTYTTYKQPYGSPSSVLNSLH